MNIVLSILIPSVPERLACLSRMIEQLSLQTTGLPVEILVILDNKKSTIGTKRNTLIAQAKGTYIVFVDDDDRLEPHYVHTLCAQIEAEPNADCIVFDVAVYFNGRFNKLCKYGIEYSFGEGHTSYYRKPNHIMCYAKRIAEQHKFRDISFGEDDEWGGRVSKDIVNQVRIPSVLYHYDCDLTKPMSWYSTS
ncbi:glycosyltransferase family A protein [Paenibacillus roseipurpureus]|uniref:Glycosyltransferase family A protein n=1 Tax=Paenibacillus roseopurpureus TaxID=2918901 RepID=A0AA96LS90_9BACL|nr:glycosyltransferase family A protein [Paenibacillus sp. MBLB1832]WNR46272.1 glycosyltransferase family A protein [Paenibacillus sp. MBLB1832]